MNGSAVLKRVARRTVQVFFRQLHGCGACEGLPPGSAGAPPACGPEARAIFIRGLGCRFRTVQALATALLLGLNALAFAADLPSSFARTWCAYQTERFKFVTDLPHRRALTKIKRLDRFRQLFLQLFPDAQGRSGLPLRMLVLRRSEDFAELSGNSAYSGVTVPSLRFYQLLIGPDPNPVFSDTGMHEYAHYLLRNQAAWNYPPWYEEGLASYLGTAQLRGSAPVLGRLGAAPSAGQGAASKMGCEEEPTYEEVVGATSLTDWPLPKLMAFYRKSWLLVHFIRLGHRLGYADLRGPLATYLADPRRDFAAAFGLSPTALGELLQSYRRRRSHPGERVNLPEPEAPVFTRRCLSAAESRMELAMSIAGLNPKLAVAALTSLDAPASADRLTALAEALAKIDPRQAAATAQEALALDPNHPGAAVAQANLKVRGCALSSRPACLAKWAQAAELYRRAWAGNSQRYDAAYGLGVAYLHTGRAEAALRHLRLAWEKMPSVVQTNFYLGEAHRILGDGQRAAAHLRKARNWALQPVWRNRAETALARLEDLGPGLEMQSPAPTGQSTAPSG